MFLFYFDTGNKKTRLFLEAGCYFVLLITIYIQLPPPLIAGIIITTTIIMAEIKVIVLFMLLNIRRVVELRIYTRQTK